MSETNGLMTADELRAQGSNGRVEVVREPLTYELTPNGPSYFRDLVRSEVLKDEHAAERLARHAKEMSVELPRRERRVGYPQDLEFEQRVNPNRTTGQGGGFAPPLWLIDKFASAPRAKRVLPQLIGTLPLPEGVSSVSVPRMTTATSASVSTDAQALTTAASIIDTEIKATVNTISGKIEPSQQWFDQTPAGPHRDTSLGADLLEAYDEQLEGQLLYGTGVNGQHLGIVTVTGINQQTAASPMTGASVTTYLGQAMAQIGKLRKKPPETWLLSTAAWAWLATSEDLQGYPFALANFNTMFPFGALVGIPAHLDDAIPANLGNSTKETEIIACCPSDLIFLEGPPRVQVAQDTSLNGTMNVRISLRRYSAFLSSRYPAGISVVGGTGLVLPAGFI